MGGGSRRASSQAEVRREQGLEGFVTFTPWGVGRDLCCSACVGSRIAFHTMDFLKIL
jgi:hypothetical protein